MFKHKYFLYVDLYKTYANKLKKKKKAEAPYYKYMLCTKSSTHKRNIFLYLKFEIECWENGYTNYILFMLLFESVF